MIKTGVIGCGYWGPNLIRNLNAQAECDLAYISDLDENRLSQVGLLYPGTTKTTDYKDILRDPEVQAVVVATPMSTHFKLGMEVQYRDDLYKITASGVLRGRRDAGSI